MALRRRWLRSSARWRSAQRGESQTHLCMEMYLCGQGPQDNIDQCRELCRSGEDCNREEFSAHACWHPRKKCTAGPCRISLFWALMRLKRGVRPFLSSLPYAISPLIWGRFIKFCIRLCRLSDLRYDEAAAAQLQASVEAERAHVQRCKDNADQLSTTLASESMFLHIVSL